MFPVGSQANVMGKLFIEVVIVLLLLTVAIPRVKKTKSVTY